MIFSQKFFDTKYKYNQTVVKVYGYGDNKKIKVIRLKCMRTSGIEDDNEHHIRGINSEKLEQSVSRTKSKIHEYAFCNPWDYFFTATLDPTKYDRTDLEKFHKDLTQWFRNYNKKYGIKIDFLLIPELHKDGKTWHMHGFLYGLPPDHLKQFKIGDTMGKSLAEKVKSGDIVYNWLAYADKFGFCDLEPIKNHEAVSKYITKYVNKNLLTSVTEINAHKYYHSRGLQQAVMIKKGTMAATIAPDYENDYCSVSWFDYSEETLQEFKSYFND